MAKTFFATFSRFEFALKRGGFLTGAPGKPAGPDWDRFAGVLGDIFYKTMSAAPEARVFFSEPPKKLMVTHPGEVEFLEQPEIKNSQQLFEAIRLVRNNLFHGEKAYLGERDIELMGAALFVLDSAFNAAMAIPFADQMTCAFAFAGINPN